jgi:hypothetical protein
MTKIEEAEYLVDHILLEQHFSISVEMSRLKGAAEVEWSTCYNGRCKPLGDKFRRDECKLDCQRRAYSSLIGKLGSARSKCRYDRNPQGCVQQITELRKQMRDKILEIRGEIYRVRRSRAAFTAGTKATPAGGGGAPGGGER